jgi:hypothetical protein
MQDYRNIPLDVLRDFARVRSEMTSIREAAAEVGIGHSTYHKFIHARTKPQPRIRRLVGLWYLAKAAEAPDVDAVRPYRAALAALLSDLPDADRDQAVSEVVAALCAVYGRYDAPRPRWLELLAAPRTPHWQSG